jgi:REP element-mobilizing transposase RayT
MALIMITHRRGVLQYAPTEARFRSPAQTIGAIVPGFKSATTKQINEMRNTPGKPVWQRNYFERLVRDEDELNRIREYILQNPAKWAENKENPGKVRAVK